MATTTVHVEGSRLTRELATYERLYEQLLSTEDGKYVLIKDEEPIGIYETEDAAIQEGYRRFGNVPFFTRRIERESSVEFVSFVWEP